MKNVEKRKSLFFFVLLVIGTTFYFQIKLASVVAPVVSVFSRHALVLEYFVSCFAWLLVVYFLFDTKIVWKLKQTVNLFLSLVFWKKLSSFSSN